MGNSIFDNPDYESPFGNWLENSSTNANMIHKDTRLSIKLERIEKISTGYNFILSIYQKDLSGATATITIYEHNHVEEHKIIVTSNIVLMDASNITCTIEVPHSRINNISRSKEYGSFEFIATIKSGLSSASSSEFELPFKNLDGMKIKEKEENKCFCNKDLTEQELKKIISDLRTIAKIKTADLFQKENCKLPNNQKSYTFLVSQLNMIFNKYNITTCIRKLHFIAQAFHETDGFQTTLEYATNKEYAPHTGRGLMQLTWKKNYKVYSAYKQQDFVNNYKDVAENLIIGADSGGWFWEKGKILESGEIWKPIKDAPDYVKKHNPQYPKNNYVLKEFGNPSNQIKYGAVDLNLIADDDLVDIISYMVNGGANGIEERRKYVEKLKTIMKYDKCVNKKK